MRLDEYGINWIDAQTSKPNADQMCLIATYGSNGFQVQPTLYYWWDGQWNSCVRTERHGQPDLSSVLAWKPRFHPKSSHPLSVSAFAKNQVRFYLPVPAIVLPKEAADDLPLSQ